MFGSLGVPELILIFVVVLIVFGPRRLPEIGKTLGKALGEFRKATDDLKSTIEREVRLEELKTIAPDIRASVDSIARSPESLFNPVSSPEPPLLQTTEAEVGDAPAAIAETPASAEVADAPGAALRPEPDYLADPDDKRPESA